MPLPDADKKSPRVYTLLQNLDLENLSADNLADVGDPIAIEEANEDELRRLCLVAFARMVTKGSFDGWLTAGGGGDAYLGGSPNGDWQSGKLDYQIITVSHGRSSQAQVALALDAGRQMFWPFTAAADGALTTIGLYIDTAVADQNVRLGIYNAADDGNPSDLIGYADFDAASTGTQYITSFSDTITLERGTLYWYAVVQTTTGSTVSLKAMNCTYSGVSYLSDNVSPGQFTCVNYTNVNELSDPAELSNMRGDGMSYPAPHVGIKWL